MMKLKVITTTFFKRSLAQSSTLPPKEKIEVKSGSEFKIHSLLEQRSHYQIVLDSSNLVNNNNTYYVFKDHVCLDAKDGLPKYVNLDIPWFSQRDNENEPFRTCNITSVAMCLAYLGQTPKDSHIQLEDELFDAIEYQGWDRYTHDDLVKLVKLYKFKDIFYVSATWDAIKKHLAEGKPIIYSGMFTGSGHIVVFRGFDETGFFVNDPYGEWCIDGYQCRSGSNLHYSYNLIQRISMNGVNSAWAHFIEK